MNFMEEHEAELQAKFLKDLESGEVAKSELRIAAKSKAESLRMQESGAIEVLEQQDEEDSE